MQLLTFVLYAKPVTNSHRPFFFAVMLLHLIALALPPLSIVTLSANASGIAAALLALFALLARTAINELFSFVSFLIATPHLDAPSLTNPERDLDLTTSTDFEDLACFAGDLAEFVHQDVSLWADVNLGHLLGGAAGFYGVNRLATRFLK